MILTYRDGKKLDHTTYLKLRGAEKLSGIKIRLTQGSYNKGVDQSANTHDAGGVVDISTNSLNSVQESKLVRALRLNGLVAWYREPIPKVWGEHIHAVDKGNPNLAPSAARQVKLQEQGYDGLKGSRPDNGPRVTIPTGVQMNNVEQFRELVQFAITEYGSKVPKKRRFARLMIAACQTALNRGPKA